MRACSCGHLLGDRQLGALGSSAAAWPVSEMNTSSSVGRCRAMSSIPTPDRVEPAHRPRRSCRGAAHRRAARCCPRASAARGTSPPAPPPRARRRAVSSSTTSSRSPPIWAFSSSEVPSAITLAVVDHDDLVGEPVGLVEVLRRQQHGGAGRDAALDRLPEREPAARVEPGGRLVEEQHRRAEHERGGEVEPAAHAAGVRLRGPLRGVASGRSARAARPRACARRRAACGRAGRPSRGSRSRSGSRRRPRTGRPARSWRAARPRRARRRGPRRARCPRRRSSSVARIRTAVVLPGAVRAEQAEHACPSARRSRRPRARPPSRRTS